MSTRPETAMGRALILAIVALLVVGVLPASAQSRAPGRDLTPGPAWQHEEQLSGADFVRPLAQARKNPTLASALVEVGQQAQGAGRAAGLRQAEAAGVDVRGERVRVAIQADGANVQAVEAAVAQAGGTVEVSAAGQVQALVPPGGLEQVASAPGVRHVDPARRTIPNATVGQEVQASGATTWQAGGAAGGGIKIAVLDGDFYGYRDRQAAGDLPATLVTHNLCGTDPFENNLDGGHGTAVAEIVYEMAPGAQLYLICASTLAQMVDAVQYMIDNQIQIVNHSRGVYNSSRADGEYVSTDAAFLPESLITKAYNNGILWVNSSGNSATTHWSGTYSDIDNDGVHNFQGNDEGNNVTIRANSTVSIFLKWDKWPTTSEDFDLFLTDLNTGQPLAFSVNEQSGSATPTEDLTYTNRTGADVRAFIAIVRYRATSNPDFDLFVEGGLAERPQFVVAARSLSDFAVSPRALVVGAACWSTPTTIETYSSQGPTIKPAITGVKPDMTGLDGMSSATFGAYTSCDGATGFFGTSAAAPSVAGAAALVKDANPTFTHNQIKDELKSRKVIDAGTAGTDTVYGTGVLTLGTPPNTVAFTCSSPRPPVNVRSTVSGGSLVTTISVDGSGGNRLLSVQIGEGTRVPVNALVSFASGPSDVTSAVTFYSPFGSTQATLTTKRQVANQAVTVPFVAVDRCGTWKSFVGGGASAGF